MAAALIRLLLKGKVLTVLHFDKLNSGTTYLIFYPRERIIYIQTESTLHVTILIALYRYTLNRINSCLLSKP